MLTELRNRGLADALIVCCDGLRGLPESIRATWPQATVQTCVVHMVRIDRPLGVEVRSQSWVGFRFECSGRLVGASGPRRGSALRPSFAIPGSSKLTARNPGHTRASTRPSSIQYRSLAGQPTRGLKIGTATASTAGLATSALARSSPPAVNSPSTPPDRSDATSNNEILLAHHLRKSKAIVWVVWGVGGGT